MVELPPRPAQKIIRRETADAWINGYEFLSLARQEAAKITSSAQYAYDRAVAEGISRGAGDLKVLLAKASDELDVALVNLDAEIVDLVLAIVRRVIDAYPPTDVVKQMARKAIAEFRHEKLQAIRSSPAMASTIQELLGEGVLIETDLGLPDNHIILSGRSSVVDVSYERIVEELKVAMLTNEASHGAR